MRAFEFACMSVRKSNGCVYAEHALCACLWGREIGACVRAPASRAAVDGGDDEVAGREHALVAQDLRHLARHVAHRGLVEAGAQQQDERVLVAHPARKEGRRVRGESRASREGGASGAGRAENEASDARDT